MSAPCQRYIFWANSRPHNLQPQQTDQSSTRGPLAKLREAAKKVKANHPETYQITTRATVINRQPVFWTKLVKICQNHLLMYKWIYTIIIYIYTYYYIYTILLYIYILYYYIYTILLYIYIIIYYYIAMLYLIHPWPLISLMFLHP